MTTLDTTRTPNPADPADSATAPLPPPPRGSRLPLLAQSVLFAKYRHRWMPALRRRHGDTFTLRILPVRTLVVLCNPEHIRSVFAGPVTTFHAGEGNKILSPVMGRRSVLTTDEAEHRRLRKLLMPPFHGPPLRGYRAMIADLAARDAQRWPVGAPFAVHERMQHLTLEIIIQVVFGVSQGERLEKLRGKLGDLVSFNLLTLFGLADPRLRRRWPWSRTVRLLEQIDTLLYAEIADRRRAPNLADRSDVLSRLLTVRDGEDRLTDAELRDQLITLLLAGHETTATALSWAFHELARDPQRARRGHEAAVGGDDSYLEAIAKESLRHHPVIYEVARVLTADIELDGYRIAAGSALMPMVGVVQADPAHHDEPGQFRPERFLDGSVAPGTWLPFGGGARRCLGAEFALLESVEVLRAVLSRYALSPDRARPEAARARNITLTPARGGRIVAAPV